LWKPFIHSCLATKLDMHDSTLLMQYVYQDKLFCYPFALLLPFCFIVLTIRWLEQHENNPYPTAEEKQLLAQRTGLTVLQVSGWFKNARGRLLPKLRNPGYNPNK